MASVGSWCYDAPHWSKGNRLMTRRVTHRDGIAAERMLANDRKDTTMTASTTERTTAQVRHETRTIREERDANDTQFRAAGTRRRNAENKLRYYPNTDTDKARLQGIIDRAADKEATLGAAIDAANARLVELKAEENAAADRERAAFRAQREKQRDNVAAFIANIVDNHPLVAEHDLTVTPTGDGASVGWDVPYEGRDGRTYVDSNRISVSLGHRWHATDREPAPATVNWSAMGSKDAEFATRYAAAMTVAAAIATALTGSGIVDESYL